MGIFDSLRKRAPNAAPIVENGASLQLLLSAPLSSDFSALQTQIRAYDSVLKAATVSGTSTAQTPGEAGSLLAQVEWGAHAVQVVAFPLPMPAEVVEKCVQPASFRDEQKAAMRAHSAHALLFYKGTATNVTEQFVATSLVAGALCAENGLGILNEGARTSLPANLLNSDDAIKPSQFWRTLPPLYLFVGFVKYNVENVSGVWMRTHGMEAFGLPNLATHASSHAQGSEIFDIFNNVAQYLMAQGPVLDAGHTMQIGDDQFMRLRSLAPGEVFLDDGAPVLVAEFIDANESNAHIFGSDMAH